MFRVGPGAAKCIIKDADNIADIIANIRGTWRTPVIKIQQLELKAQPVALHNHVVRVQVAMLLAQRMYTLNAFGQRVQQVDSGERWQAFAALAL